MRLAYSTLACPRWTVEEAVAAAVRYGYDAIEWRLADGAIIEPDTPVSVRRRLREVPAANGIAIACLDTSCQVVQASPEERTAVTEAAQRMIDMAAELDAPLLRVFGGPLPGGTTHSMLLAPTAEVLHAICTYAAQHLIQVSQCTKPITENEIAPFLPATIRISGIVTDGGEAVNIIPSHTSARYNLRAPTFDELLDLRARVTRCFEAGALATGTHLEIVGGDKPYAHLVQNPTLAELYRRNAEALGRVVQAGPRSGAGTDMGNISLVIPSIQPNIGINCLPAINHQPEFAVACVTPEADKAVLDGALAMAWTTIDLALDQTLRDQLMHH